MLFSRVLLCRVLRECAAAFDVAKGASWQQIKLAAMLLLAGCFGPPVAKYDMLPVEGTVTLEGRPLANAEVMFDSVDMPRGFGVTDENGRFSIVTRQFGAGLPAGQYRVLVGGSEKTSLGGGPVELAAAYRETGVGRVTIEPGGSPLAFDLKRKAAAVAGGQAEP
ncbi:MAG: carboxypeptidase-like regulatory domain-containing protein [Planctomycetaceae bacterium]